MSLFDPPSYVSVPASIARSRREADSGKWNERRSKIMSYLLGSPSGLTWQEVSNLEGGHHGQVSSALNSLHRNGWVFSLREIRNGCHPYVHHTYRDDYDDEDVYDTPQETKAGKNRTAYKKFEERIRQAVYAADYANQSQSSGWGMDDLVRELSYALSRLDEQLDD